MIRYSQDKPWWIWNGIFFFEGHARGYNDGHSNGPQTRSGMPFIDFFGLTPFYRISIATLYSPNHDWELWGGEYGLDSLLGSRLGIPFLSHPFGSKSPSGQVSEPVLRCFSSKLNNPTQPLSYLDLTTSFLIYMLIYLDWLFVFSQSWSEPKPSPSLLDQYCEVSPNMQNTQPSLCEPIFSFDPVVIQSHWKLLVLVGLVVSIS